MRIIILAAGQGFQVDGMNKCMIKDPLTGQRIIEKIILAFTNYQISVVVGYQSISIMQEYPNLHYIYNQDWGITHNSYSLALAITDEPCYVLSCDLMFEPELISYLGNAPENAVLTKHSENREINSVHCCLDGNRIVETYVGPVHNQADPEVLGIFKISDANILRKWKQNCLDYRNLFVAQNLPLGECAQDIYSADLENHRLDEINTPGDYMRLLNKLN